jgi:hypothetical protein
MNSINCGLEQVKPCFQSTAMIEDRTIVHFFANTSIDPGDQHHWRRTNLLSNLKSIFVLSVIHFGMTSRREKMRTFASVNNGGSVLTINEDVVRDNVSNKVGSTTGNGIVPMRQTSTSGWHTEVNRYSDKLYVTISVIDLISFLISAINLIHSFVFHLEQSDKDSHVLISVKSAMDTLIVREH